MKKYISIGIASMILLLFSGCKENNNGTSVALKEIINNWKENVIVTVSNEIINGYCTHSSQTLAVRLRNSMIQELISASRSELACRNQ